MSSVDPERARLLSELEVGMNRIARVINSRRLSRTLEDRSGIRLSQLTVATLAAIRRRGAARLTDVARDVGYEPSRVSKEIQRLVAAELVEQERAESDKRSYVLTVTKAGDEAYVRYRRAADRLVADALAEWSDDDVRELTRLMTRLAESSSVPADEPPWSPALPPADPR